MDQQEKSKDKMKVKELIKELEKIDGELEVMVCDEVEGNDGLLTNIETKNHKEFNRERRVYFDKLVAMIRWA